MERHVSSGRLTVTGRPWGVALLVWVGVCCVLAPVLLAELQLHGREHFTTSKGTLEVLGFMRTALIYPGPVLPALVVLVPRWSALLCGLLLAACIALLVLTFLQGAPFVRTFAFWAGRVLPATLAAIALLRACRRRDWLAARR